MPRNPAGVYTLPDPPRVPGTIIDAPDENITRDDMAVEFTSSLDRSGRGPMLAPIRLVDGSMLVPAYSWTAEQNSGWYRAGAGDFRFSILGVDVFRLTPTGIVPIQPIRFPDGTVLLPGISWQNEVDSGWYRAAAQDFRYSIAGVDTFQLTPGVADTMGNTALMTGSFRLRTLTPPVIAAPQNDYAPAGLDAAGMLRLSASLATSLTGLTGGADGRVVTLHNIGAFPLTLTDEDAGSAAANRFSLVLPVTLELDGVLTLQYDSASLRWRMVGAPPVIPAQQASIPPMNVNPDLLFDQINEGTTYYTPVPGGTLSMDGWVIQGDGVGQYVVQRAVPVTDRFAMQIAVSIPSPVLAAADFYSMYTAVEGYDATILNAGRPDAKPITVMIEFQSSKLGLYTICINNTAVDRSYVTTFDVLDGNIHKYSITIPIDVVGVWNGFDQAALYCRITLASGANHIGAPDVWHAGQVFAAVGQVNFLDAANLAYLYKCHIIPAAEERSFYQVNYALQLAKCQRYYQKSTQYELLRLWGVNTGYWLSFKTQMRTVPVISTAGTAYGGSAGGGAAVNISTGGFEFIFAGATPYGDYANVQWRANARIS